MSKHTRIVYTCIAAVLLGCDADTPPLGPGPDLPPPSFQTITQPTITVTLTPTRSDQNLPRDSVVAYTSLTLATVSATGLLQISYSSAPGWGSNAGTVIGPWDAGGKVGGDLTCSGNVYAGIGGALLGFCDGSNAAPQDTWSVHAILQGTVRVGWDRGPVTSTGFCDGGTFPPCYTYTGSHTVKITPEPVDFDVTASPTTVNYKDTVTVTITVAPAQAYGLTVPWKVDSTKWAPVSGTQTAPCQWSDFAVVDPGTRRCRKPFTRSGTLTVYTTVNGAKTQKALAITVTPPTLKVTASPNTIPGAQSVTFTAVLTPSGVTWNVSQWLFRPDTGALNSGISPSPCQWTDNPCTRTISKSGWMKATATVGEYPLADSARVYIIPCPTGDSLADRESVRKLLRDLWSQSNPTAPPANRIERGGRVYDSLGTDIGVPGIQDPGDTPCLNSNQPTRALPLIIDGHTHPFRPGVDTLPWQQCHFSAPGPGSYYIMDMTWGGPSAPDWVRSWVDQRPNFVMDADSIYIFGPPDSLHAVPSPKNPADTSYVPAGNWRSKIRAYPRNTGTCSRP